MKKYFLYRIYLLTETLGSIFDEAGMLICKTMELPWRDNKIGATHEIASCIPEGTYIVEKQAPTEKRPYGFFRFRAIKDRSINKWVKDKLGKAMSSILIHRITYVKDLLGCIGVGGRFHDFDNDGVPDMADSGKKLQWMYDNLPDVFELTISEKK